MNQALVTGDSSHLEFAIQFYHFVALVLLGKSLQLSKPQLLSLSLSASLIFFFLTTKLP